MDIPVLLIITVIIIFIVGGIGGMMMIRTAILKRLNPPTPVPEDEKQTPLELPHSDIAASPPPIPTEIPSTQQPAATVQTDTNKVS